jgi:hypothetical protein
MKNENSQEIEVVESKPVQPKVIAFCDLSKIKDKDRVRFKTEKVASSNDEQVKTEPKVKKERHKPEVKNYPVPEKGKLVTFFNNRSGIVTGYKKIGKDLCILIDGEKEPQLESELFYVLSITDPVYEKVVVHFFKDLNKKIVGRLENGKICIIDFNYNGTWVNDNEDWEVEIRKDFEKKAIVYPLNLVKTSEENQKSFLDTLKTLKSKDWNKTTERGKSAERRPFDEKKNYIGHKQY